MTPEMRRSIARRARELQVRLNGPGVDPVTAANDARRVFEDAGDDVRTHWLTLELAGYADHVPARPLHVVLGVPERDRLAAHVAAYRSQVAVSAAAESATEFRHFFVEPLQELVVAQTRVRTPTAPPRLILEFAPEPGSSSYPRSAAFTPDVFDRIVLGFIAALHLQLGTWT